MKRNRFGIDSERQLTSGPITGTTDEEQAQAQATSIAETVSAVCQSLVAHVYEEDASDDETQIVSSH